MERERECVCVCVCVLALVENAKNKLGKLEEKLECEECEEQI